MAVYLNQFNNKMSNADARAHIKLNRWKDGFMCPRCGSTEGTQLETRDVIQCRACRKQTSPTANTGLHKTKSLALILQLANRLINGRHDSTKAIAAELHSNYATIWCLIHKVRLAIDFFVALEPAYKIECAQLRAGLFKPSSERSRESFLPVPIEMYPHQDAPKGVIADAVRFFLAVFWGVSRKYSQLYLNEFAFWSSGAYPSGTQITLALLRPVAYRGSEVYRYRSPPVLLIRQQPSPSRPY